MRDTVPPEAPPPGDPTGDPQASGEAMQRNLRLLPWWWVLRWAWFAEAIWVIYLIEGRGLSLAQVFVFEAAFFAVVIVAEIPTGIVADRWGRRASLIVGTAITVAGFLAFGTGAGLAILLFAYLLLGLGEAFMSGADSAMLFDTLRRLGRGEDFGRLMGRYNAMVTAAIAAFTLVGAGLVRWTPLSWPILLSAVVSLPAVLLAWRLVEPPATEERVGWRQTGGGALRAVLGSPPILAATALMALATVGIIAMSAALQPVVVDYGVPPYLLGPFVGAQMLSSALGALAAAPALRLLGLRRIFWLMPVAGSLSLLAGASGVAWLFPLFILPSVTFNILYIHVIDFVSRRVSESLRATAVSIVSVMASAANVVGALLFAAAIEVEGLDRALVTGGLVLAALSTVAFLAWLRSRDIELEPTAAAPA